MLDTAGNGGLTTSGVAIGGNGPGGGGIAVSGSTGTANGGSVYNEGAIIVNGPGSSEYPALVPRLAL